MSEELRLEDLAGVGPVTTKKLNDAGIHNMMDNYEKSLSQNFGVKSVKEKATDQRPKDEVKADEKSKDVGDVEKDLQKPVEAS